MYSIFNSEASHLQSLKILNLSVKYEGNVFKNIKYLLNTNCSEKQCC